MGPTSPSSRKASSLPAQWLLLDQMRLRTHPPFVDLIVAAATVSPASVECQAISQIHPKTDLFPELPNWHAVRRQPPATLQSSSVDGHYVRHSAYRDEALAASRSL